MQSSDASVILFEGDGDPRPQLLDAKEVVRAHEMQLWVNELIILHELSAGLGHYLDQIVLTAFDLVYLGEHDLNGFVEVPEVIEHLDVVRLEADVSVDTEHNQVKPHAEA